eukprot:1148954-Prymnesium_polylepis.1
MYVCLWPGLGRGAFAHFLFPSAVERERLRTLSWAAAASEGIRVDLGNAQTMRWGFGSGIGAVGMPFESSVPEDV